MAFDISSILKQLDNINTGKISNEEAAIKELAGNGFSLTNSIYNKDTDKLPQEILKLAKTAASLFDLGTNNASEASQEVAQQNQEIASANEKSNDIFASVNDRLQTILDNCGNTEASIREALDEIQKLGGDIEKLQTKLEEKIAELDKQKEILNNENSTSAQRKEAIATILKIAGEIDELFAEVGEYKEELEAQQDTATDKTENLKTQSEELDNVITEGTEDITGVTKETSEIVTDATVMGTESIKDEVTGGEKITIGTAMESGPQALVTGSTGAQYIASGTDDEIAGGIRKTGATTAIAQTATLLGSILTKVGEFANNANTIGQYTDEVSNIIGSFNSTLEPMIQSIGSWEGIAKANEDLKSYTTEYASQIGMSDEEIAKLGSEDINNEETEVSNLTFKQYEFDFKEAFKIEK